jgi:hypothetical protein
MLKARLALAFTFAVFKNCETQLQHLSVRSYEPARYLRNSQIFLVQGQICTENDGSSIMSLTHVSVSRNHAATVSSTTQRPPWLDEQLYPFQSRFVEVEGNRIHYIDEGAGPTLFFVHPGVGWSFMYSDIIQELRGRFRCVALDLPGFGLSAAAPGFEHPLQLFPGVHAQGRDKKTKAALFRPGEASLSRTQS